MYINVTKVTDKSIQFVSNRHYQQLRGCGFNPGLISPTFNICDFRSIVTYQSLPIYAFDFIVELQQPTPIFTIISYIFYFKYFS